MFKLLKHPYFVIILAIAIIAYIGYYHVYLPKKIEEYKINKRVEEKTSKIINKRRADEAKQLEQEISNDIDEPYIVDTDGMLF